MLIKATMIFGNQRLLKQHGVNRNEVSSPESALIEWFIKLSGGFKLPIHIVFNMYTGISASNIRMALQGSDEI